VASGAGPLGLQLGNLFLEAKHISKIVVVRSMEVLVKKGGIIEIPNSVMVELDLSEGKRLFLNVKDGKILIKPAKNIAERLAGSIALDDVDLIDEIVESEDWL
jgi:antitoxin component of MazEF toxin-antitoxin module